MAQLVLLRGAKQLLTLRGPSGVRRGAALQDLGIIEDGSVLIRDGIIVAVGSTRRLENLKESRTALEIPVNGRVVMPGFVDAGLSLTLDGPGDSHRRKSAAEFYEESLALMRSCLQHGTLAADIKAAAAVTGDGEHFRRDISMLRKLATIGSNPVRMVRSWHVDRSLSAGPNATDAFREAFHVLTRRKLIHFIELTSESERALDAASLDLIAQARIGIKLFWPGGPVDELVSALTRLRPRSVCCGAHSSSAEFDALATAHSIVAFATGKDVFEGPVASSARRFVDAGGAIALSSGYASGSAASFSMQMSVALAVVRLRLTPEEALSAATINAAHAAGCAHLTGSLESGKQADVLILNIADYREVPRQFGINHVEMALRQGNVVLNRTRWKAAAT